MHFSSPYYHQLRNRHISRVHIFLGRHASGQCPATGQGQVLKSVNRLNVFPSVVHSSSSQVFPRIATRSRTVYHIISSPPSSHEFVSRRKCLAAAFRATTTAAVTACIFSTTHSDFVTGGAHRGSRLLLREEGISIRLEMMYRKWGGGVGEHSRVARPRRRWC